MALVAKERKSSYGMAWHGIVRRMAQHSIAYTNIDSIALANNMGDLMLKYQGEKLISLIYSYVMLPCDLILLLHPFENLSGTEQKQHQAQPPPP